MLKRIYKVLLSPVNRFLADNRQSSITLCSFILLFRDETNFVDRLNAQVLRRVKLVKTRVLDFSDKLLLST